jgi:SAM-dependent methyltransferase
MMIEVPPFPLYWRFKDRPGNAAGEPPARAPFTFDYDPALDLVIERRSPGLTRLLDDIYSRDANVGFLQDGHSHVQNYGADFWRYLSGLAANYKPRNVLEVGCGGCILLERFRNEGCTVLGVDPSPVASAAGARKNIEVIAEYFPPKSLPMTPDLIFQVDVLEHIEDPVGFLRMQAECLAENGLIVVNVPDSTLSISRGDISMALHQHVNMYERHSLENVFTAAGLEVVSLESSRYGSALYCAGRKRPAGATVSAKSNPERWREFVDIAKRNIATFERHITEARNRGDAIGFFMPQRAFPYLGFMEWWSGYRLFDNMNVWHRRYLDGVEVMVENQADLVADPVDHVFIMSLTFGRDVGAALNRDVPRMKTTTLEQMLAK